MPEDVTVDECRYTAMGKDGILQFRRLFSSSASTLESIRPPYPPTMIKWFSETESLNISNEACFRSAFNRIKYLGKNNKERNLYLVMYLLGVGHPFILHALD